MDSKKRLKLKGFIYLAISVFVCVVLLSQVAVVQANDNVKAPAQESSDGTRAEAQRLLDEAEKLRKQGTAKSLRSSIEKLFETLKLCQEICDEKSQAYILNNIGYIYDSLGEKQQALKFYNQSLPLSIEVADKAQQAKTLNNIGGVYDSFGDKQQALKFYNQSLPLKIEVGDKAGQAITLNNIGGVYFSLGDKQQALKFYNQSLPLTIEVGDKAGQAITLNNIGRVYLDLGDKQQALKFYNQSLPLRIEVGDKAGQAVTLNNIGCVYSLLGDKQQALKFYNQSLPLRIEIGDKAGQAVILNNIGRVYLDLGDKQQALKFYNQSLPLSVQVGDKAGQATILWNIAYLERNRGNISESLKQIQAAIEIIESLRKTYTNKDLQSTYFSTVQDYYQFDINLLMELHKKYPNQGYDTTAFNISERARARSLVDLLAESNANIRKGVDPKLFEEEQLILGKIEAVQKRLQEPSTSKDKTGTEKLKQENENLLNQYRELVDKIRTTSPQYGDIQYPEPLELKQIQQQLDKDTLLLQY
ncbi:hypothetical protein NIES2101_43450, partial [Calothrix sp. HK-06]